VGVVFGTGSAGEGLWGSSGEVRVLDLVSSVEWQAIPIETKTRSPRGEGEGEVLDDVLEVVVGTVPLRHWQIPTMGCNGCASARVGMSWLHRTSMHSQIKKVQFKCVNRPESPLRHH